MGDDSYLFKELVVNGLSWGERQSSSGGNLGRQGPLGESGLAVPK